jgi:colicin import membrane protein
VSDRTPRPDDPERPGAVAAGDDAPTEIREPSPVSPSAPTPEPSRAAREADSQEIVSREELEARAAQVREEARVADARRAEEARAEADKAAETARKAEEDARERATAATRDAERARGDAGLAPGGSVTGASIAGPGIGTTTEPRTAAAAGAGSRATPASLGAEGEEPSGPAADRPELLVGGAFVGAFLVGRLIKRIVD